MHFFGLDTKAARSEGQTLPGSLSPVLRLSSLVRVPATSGVALIGSQGLSPRRPWPYQYQLGTLTSPYPLCCDAYASAATISRRHTTEHATEEARSSARWSVWTHVRPPLLMYSFYQHPLPTLKVYRPFRGTSTH
ncbi:hypothetical protein HDV63DRAFT_372238 [Trichoderma sp. SZMC 28014]